jgi:hypothetical protein
MTAAPNPPKPEALASLVRHLGESMRELLPTGLTVQTAELEFALVRRGPDGSARAVRTLRVRPDSGPLTAESVADLLGELQREIGRHLGRPWPNNRHGVALYAAAEQVGDEIRLRFVGRGNRANTPSIELRPFPLPPHAAQT